MEEFRSLMLEAQTISRFGADDQAIALILNSSARLDTSEKVSLYSTLLKSTDISDYSRSSIEHKLALVVETGETLTYRFIPHVLNNLRDERLLFDILSKTNYAPASFLVTVRELLTDRKDLSDTFLNKLIDHIKDRFSSVGSCFGTPSESDIQESSSLIILIKNRMGNPVGQSDLDRTLATTFRVKSDRSIPPESSSTPPKKTQI